MHLPWLCARGAHVYTIIMLTISDMTYTVISVFSVTPPMLLENGITFVRRSCMLSVFRSRIEGAAPLQSFRSKTEGRWRFAFSFKISGFRTAASFGLSFRNRRCRMAPPRAFSFNNRGCFGQRNCLRVFDEAVSFDHFWLLTTEMLLDNCISVMGRRFCASAGPWSSSGALRRHRLVYVCRCPLPLKLR